MWLDLAVMKGDKAAKRQRASAERNMSSDQIAEAKRLFALLQEVGPSKLSMPQIGAKVSPDVMNARNRSQVCRVDTNRNDPCALVKIRGALITVAWNQRSKTVTYLFTEDTSFVTDSELSLGGSCRIAESRSEPIHYLDWLLTPDWADTAHYVSGYTTAWYAALRTDGEYPGYGRIAGFVQSRYAKFKR
jgi:hypothetical protein